MPRVLPSQIVTMIDQVYPWAKLADPGAAGSLEPTHAPTVGAIAELIDRMPERLLSALTPGEHAQFVAALAGLRVSLKMWETLGDFDSLHTVRSRGELGGGHPVSTVRALLAKCPDEAPSESVSEMNFLSDSELAEELRLDITTAHSAHGNGEFKAAAVMAGSVIEALLLWALLRRPPGDCDSAFRKWAGRRADLRESPPRSLKSDLLKWDLEEYIAIARYIPLLSSETLSHWRRDLET